ncbi:hypothetical protein ccbrp13_32510 [Ktedonobacteria bacterium brp13]|nr:hypothetical protein ccbrp13_32510 [Ktedonobacteria bacterium brp13]
MKLYSYFTKTVNKSTMPSPEPKKHAAQGIQGTYGRFIYRSRWLLLLLWIAVLLGCLPWARLVGGALSSGGYMQSDSEASLVEQALISQWHQGASHLFVLLTSHSTRINSPAYQRQFQYVIHWAERVPDVSSVSESPGKDGYTAVVRLDFGQTSPTQVSHIPSFNDQLASLPPGAAHLLLTGDAAIRSDWQQIAEEDSRRAELIALPLVLCLLLLIFRSVVASLMPILLAVASVTGAEAMLYGLATHREVSIFALNVVTLVCLGLSIDYSLLLIHRFREELAREQTVEQALAITLATAGSAVFHSGLMVLLGFSGLLFIDLALLRSFGLGGICATTLAVLASLTLLPALLAIIGKRLDRFSFAFPRVTLPSRASQRLDTQSLWRRGAQMVMAHPMWVLLLVLSILIGLGWPALLLKPGMPGIKGLPDDSRARQGLELLRAQFPAFTDDTLLLLVQTADRSNLLSRPQHLLQLKTLTDWVSTLPHVTGVKGLMHPPQTLKSLSPTSLIQLYALDSSQLPPDIRVLVNTTTTGESTLLTITSNAPDGSDEEQQLLQRLHTIPPSISLILTHILQSDKMQDEQTRHTGS